ncbi:ASCH domain-containing protein [Aureimonas populi]|uniref:ASCH domain-containing protein n=1 Tax=Aureimonas populi TaxID=1701758 RepID=A0ABW5CQE9_9HYPH|nr:ASCH domain-containing protein [Aureimonas populi]
MKALSIVAPGGSRIASGDKTLEVRRWKPNLHADEDLLIVENRRFLRNDGEEDDAGIAVALVRVANVRPFVPDDMVAACGSSFEEGWLAWELVDVRPLSSTFNVKAARGMYDIDSPSDLPIPL